MTIPQEPDNLRLYAGVAIFVAVVWFGLQIFGALVPPAAGLVVVSVTATFLSGVAANTLTVVFFANGKLRTLGLAWKPGTGRFLMMGIAAGAGAGVVVLAGPLLAGMARFESEETAGPRWLGIAVMTGLLFLGALGEELIFHGFAFQALMSALGTFQAILPMGVVFGFAHLGNRNVNPLGIINTMAWGVLLGWGFWRSQSLWLPIGLHFGWNLVQPLLGAPLSGFTMSLTGYTLVWKVGALWSGGGYGPEGSLLTTVAVIWLFFLLGWLTRQPEVEDA